MTQDDAIATLKAAYDAANDALEKAQDANADPATIKRLNDAANFALLCLAQAMKEALTVNTDHTQEIKAELDQITTELKNDLSADKKISEIISDVDKVVQLAASLASAFA